MEDDAMKNIIECWPCDPRGSTEPTPNGRPLFFHLFNEAAKRRSIAPIDDATADDSITHIDVELPNGKIFRYLAPIAGEALSERAFQSIAAALCLSQDRFTLPTKAQRRGAA
jgi:hypothetical protein